MPDLWYYLLTMMAVYRAAIMVVKDEGPFRIFARVRDLDRYQHTWVGRGLNCPNCVSFWVALLVAICWWCGVYTSPVVVGFILWFSLMFWVYIFNKAIYKFLDR